MTQVKLVDGGINETSGKQNFIVYNAKTGKPFPVAGEAYARRLIATKVWDAKPPKKDGK